MSSNPTTTNVADAAPRIIRVRVSWVVRGPRTGVPCIFLTSTRTLCRWSECNLGHPPLLLRDLLPKVPSMLGREASVSGVLPRHDVGEGKR